MKRSSSKAAGVAAICLAILLSGTYHSEAFFEVDHSNIEAVRECIECHPRAVPSHMRRSPETMKEPLPLDRRGRMLCITCHDCVTGTCVLREPKEKLCAVCHDCTQGMACVIGTPHMGNTENAERFAVSECRTCHKNSKATEECWLGNRTVGMLEIGDLSDEAQKRMVFVDKRVTCVSCHNPYSTKESKLVRSNKHGKLCQTCHSEVKKLDHSKVAGVDECKSCHPRTEPSHELKMPESVKADWPLDEEGKMECITCHDCITGTCLVRAGGRELCSVCHDCTMGMGCILGTPHLGSLKGGTKVSTEGCLSCHDGATGPEACDSGVRKVRLDKRVTCLSCHDPYKKSHKDRLKTEGEMEFCPRNVMGFKERQDRRFCIKCHVSN